MKKFISILSVLALLMGLFTSCGRSDEERSKILKIYNWGDYIDEDVLTDFPKWYKEQTGEEVRIIYQVFDINEIMLTKIERGHEDFDLICPSEYILERMLRKNLLLPIDRNFGKTPDYINNVSPYIQEELNKVVEEGMFNISIASVVTVDENGADAMARIENIAANHHHMKVTITLDGETEPIYESAGIAPGQYIEHVKLNRTLSAGTYSATALFTAYDMESLSQAGQAAAQITIVAGS